MDLTPFVDSLRRDLLTAAAAGTEETRRTAELLVAAMDPAVRLAILDALSAATADVTAALPGVTVEVRMQGREPRISVDTVDPEPDPRPTPDPGPADDAGTAAGWPPPGRLCPRLTRRPLTGHPPDFPPVAARPRTGHRPDFPPLSPR